MSLNFWKREKNFMAQDKGYVRDPEGFPFKFLLERLDDEIKELKESLEGYYAYDLSSVGEAHQESIIKECADISNLVDYIYSKTIMRLPDKYMPLEDSG